MFQSVETGHTRPRGETGPGSLSGNRKFSQHKDGVSGGRDGKSRIRRDKPVQPQKVFKSLVGPLFPNTEEPWSRKVRESDLHFRRITLPAGRKPGGRGRRQSPD